MPEQRDSWSRIEIGARILTPLVIFGLGIWFNIHQQSKDAVDIRTQRYMEFGKMLSSDKALERTLALSMFEIERVRHLGDVPDELLSIAIPQLVALASTDPNADVAKRAQQLALDLSKNTRYAELVVGKVVRAPALVYFHIQDEMQRQQARDYVAQLQTRFDATQLIVPGIQRVDVGPGRMELRYFRKNEESDANRIRDALQKIGLNAPTSYVSGYEQSQSLRPLHFELWFGPAKK
jgi:hypothetical protein